MSPSATGLSVVDVAGSPPNIALPAQLNPEQLSTLRTQVRTLAEQFATERMGGRNGSAVLQQLETFLSNSFHGHQFSQVEAEAVRAYFLHIQREQRVVLVSNEVNRLYTLAARYDAISQNPDQQSTLGLALRGQMQQLRESHADLFSDPVLATHFGQVQNAAETRIRNLRIDAENRAIVLRHQFVNQSGFTGSVSHRVIINQVRGLTGEQWLLLQAAYRRCGGDGNDGDIIYQVNNAKYCSYAANAIILPTFLGLSEARLTIQAVDRVQRQAVRIPNSTVSCSAALGTFDRDAALNQIFLSRNSTERHASLLALQLQSGQDPLQTLLTASNSSANFGEVIRSFTTSYGAIANFGIIARLSESEKRAIQEIITSGTLSLENAQRALRERFLARGTEQGNPLALAGPGQVRTFLATCEAQELAIIRYNQGLLNRFGLSAAHYLGVLRDAREAQYRSRFNLRIRQMSRDLGEHQAIGAYHSNEESPVQLEREEREDRVLTLGGPALDRRPERGCPEANSLSSNIPESLASMHARLATEVESRRTALLDEHAQLLLVGGAVEPIQADANQVERQSRALTDQLLGNASSIYSAFRGGWTSLGTDEVAFYAALETLPPASSFQRGGEFAALGQLFRDEHPTPLARHMSMSAHYLSRTYRGALGRSLDLDMRDELETGPELDAALALLRQSRDDAMAARLLLALGGGPNTTFGNRYGLLHSETFGASVEPVRDLLQRYRREIDEAYPNETKEQRDRRFNQLVEDSVRRIWVHYQDRLPTGLTQGTQHRTLTGDIITTAPAPLTFERLISAYFSGNSESARLDRLSLIALGTSDEVLLHTVEMERNRTNPRQFAIHCESALLGPDGRPDPSRVARMQRIIRDHFLSSLPDEVRNSSNLLRSYIRLRVARSEPVNRSRGGNPRGHRTVLMNEGLWGWLNPLLSIRAGASEEEREQALIVSRAGRTRYALAHARWELLEDQFEFRLNTAQQDEIIRIRQSGENQELSDEVIQQQIRQREESFRRAHRRLNHLIVHQFQQERARERGSSLSFTEAQSVERFNEALLQRRSGSDQRRVRITLITRLVSAGELTEAERATSLVFQVRGPTDSDALRGMFDNRAADATERERATEMLRGLGRNNPHRISRGGQRLQLIANQATLEELDQGVQAVLRAAGVSPCTLRNLGGRLKANQRFDFQQLMQGAPLSLDELEERISARIRYEIRGWFVGWSNLSGVAICDSSNLRRSLFEIQELRRRSRNHGAWSQAELLTVGLEIQERFTKQADAFREAKEKAAEAAINAGSMVVVIGAGLFTGGKAWYVVLTWTAVSGFSYRFIINTAFRGNPLTGGAYDLSALSHDLLDSLVEGTLVAVCGAAAHKLTQAAVTRFVVAKSKDLVLPASVSRYSASAIKEYIIKGGVGNTLETTAQIAARIERAALFGAKVNKLSHNFVVSGLGQLPAWGVGEFLAGGSQTFVHALLERGWSDVIQDLDEIARSAWDSGISRGQHAMMTTVWMHPVFHFGINPAWKALGQMRRSMAGPTERTGNKGVEARETSERSRGNETSTEGRGNTRESRRASAERRLLAELLGVQESAVPVTGEATIAEVQAKLRSLGERANAVAEAGNQKEMIELLLEQARLFRAASEYVSSEHCQSESGEVTPERVDAWNTILSESFRINGGAGLLALTQVALVDTTGSTVQAEAAAAELTVPGRSSSPPMNTVDGASRAQTGEPRVLPSEVRNLVAREGRLTFREYVAARDALMENIRNQAELDVVNRAFDALYRERGIQTWSAKARDLLARLDRTWFRRAFHFGRDTLFHGNESRFRELGASDRCFSSEFPDLGRRHRELIEHIQRNQDLGQHLYDVVAAHEGALRGLAKGWNFNHSNFELASSLGRMNMSSWAWFSERRIERQFNRQFNAATNDAQRIELIHSRRVLIERIPPTDQFRWFNPSRWFASRFSNFLPHRGAVTAAELRARGLGADVLLSLRELNFLNGENPRMPRRAELEALLRSESLETRSRAAWLENQIQFNWNFGRMGYREFCRAVETHAAQWEALVRENSLATNRPPTISEIIKAMSERYTPVEQIRKTALAYYQRVRQQLESAERDLRNGRRNKGSQEELRRLHDEAGRLRRLLKVGLSGVEKLDAAHAKLLAQRAMLLDLLPCIDAKGRFSPRFSPEQMTVASETSGRRSDIQHLVERNSTIENRRQFFENRARQLRLIDPSLTLDTTLDILRSHLKASKAGKAENETRTVLRRVIECELIDRFLRFHAQCEPIFQTRLREIFDRFPKKIDRLIDQIARRLQSRAHGRQGPLESHEILEVFTNITERFTRSVTREALRAQRRSAQERLVDVERRLLEAKASQDRARARQFIAERKMLRRQIRRHNEKRIEERVELAELMNSLARTAPSDATVWTENVSTPLLRQQSVVSLKGSKRHGQNPGINETGRLSESGLLGNAILSRESALRYLRQAHLTPEEMPKSENEWREVMERALAQEPRSEMSQRIRESGQMMINEAREASSGIFSRLGASLRSLLYRNPRWALEEARLSQASELLTPEIIRRHVAASLDANTTGSRILDFSRPIEWIIERFTGRACRIPWIPSLPFPEAFVTSMPNWMLPIVRMPFFSLLLPSPTLRLRIAERILLRDTNFRLSDATLHQATHFFGLRLRAGLSRAEAEAAIVRKKTEVIAEERAARKRGEVPEVTLLNATAYEGILLAAFDKGAYHFCLRPFVALKRFFRSQRLGNGEGAVESQSLKRWLTAATRHGRYRRQALEITGLDEFHGDLDYWVIRQLRNAVVVRDGRIIGLNHSFLRRCSIEVQRAASRIKVDSTSKGFFGALDYLSQYTQGFWEFLPHAFRLPTPRRAHLLEFISLERLQNVRGQWERGLEQFGIRDSRWFGFLNRLGLGDWFIRRRALSLLNSRQDRMNSIRRNIQELQEILKDRSSAVQDRSILQRRLSRLQARLERKANAAERLADRRDFMCDMTRHTGIMFTRSYSLPRYAGSLRAHFNEIWIPGGNESRAFRSQLRAAERMIRRERGELSTRQRLYQQRDTMIEQLERIFSRQRESVSQCARVEGRENDPVVQARLAKIEANRLQRLDWVRGASEMLEEYHFGGLLGFTGRGARQMFIEFDPQLMPKLGVGVKQTDYFARRTRSLFENAQSGGSGRRMQAQRDFRESLRIVNQNISDPGQQVFMNTLPRYLGYSERARLWRQFRSLVQRQMRAAKGDAARLLELEASVSFIDDLFWRPRASWLHLTLRARPLTHEIRTLAERRRMIAERSQALECVKLDPALQVYSPRQVLRAYYRELALAPHRAAELELARNHLLHLLGKPMRTAKPSELYWFERGGILNPLNWPLVNLLSVDSSLRVGTQVAEGILSFIPRRIRQFPAHVASATADVVTRGVHTLTYSLADRCSLVWVRLSFFRSFRVVRAEYSYQDGKSFSELLAESRAAGEQMQRDLAVLRLVPRANLRTRDLYFGQQSSGDPTCVKDPVRLRAHVESLLRTAQGDPIRVRQILEAYHRYARYLEARARWTFLFGIIPLPPKDSYVGRGLRFFFDLAIVVFFEIPHVWPHIIDLMAEIPLLRRLFGLKPRENSLMHLFLGDFLRLTGRWKYLLRNHGSQLRITTDGEALSADEGGWWNDLIQQELNEHRMRNNRPDPIVGEAPVAFFREGEAPPLWDDARAQLTLPVWTQLEEDDDNKKGHGGHLAANERQMRRELRDLRMPPVAAVPRRNAIPRRYRDNDGENT